MTPLETLNDPTPLKSSCLNEAIDNLKNDNPRLDWSEVEHYMEQSVEEQHSKSYWIECRNKLAKIAEIFDEANAFSLRSDDINEIKSIVEPYSKYK